MAREMLDVRRCTRCGCAVQVFVRDTLNEGTEDETIAYYWTERFPHGQTECDRVVTIQAEEWPVLFEMER